MPFIIDFWHWWVFAVVLIIIEILVPSFFALWMAIAAFIIGLILLVFPDIGWQFQWLMFAVLSVLSSVVWRRYYVKHPIATDEPLLNRRGEQHVGRIITLASPIVNGQGKVILDDSTWKVHGPDCSAGTRVQVIAVDNVILKVTVLD